MLEWWNAMNVFQQIMASIAIPASILLLLQLILLLFGFGHDGDISDGMGDSDMSCDGAGDVGGLKMLSIRGVIAFLAVGGWVAVLAVNLGAQNWLGALLGVASGAGVAFLIALGFRAMQKLTNSGNISIATAVGKTGTVYIPVAANRKPGGKVTFTIQERFVEFDAITTDLTPIATGTQVTITGTIDENTVIVIPFIPEKKEE